MDWFSFLKYVLFEYALYLFILNVFLLMISEPFKRRGKVLVRREEN